MNENIIEFALDAIIERIMELSTEEQYEYDLDIYGSYEQLEITMEKYKKHLSNAGVTTSEYNTLIDDLCCFVNEVAHRAFKKGYKFALNSMN